MQSTEPRAASPGFRYQEPALFILAAFVVYVVAHYMQWSARRSIFAAVRFEFVLGLSLTISCALIQARKKYSYEAAKQLLLWLVLLFVVMVIQIPFAANGIQAWNLFFDRVIKFSMLSFFIIIVVRSPRSMRFFIGAFLFALFYVTQESTQGAISGSMVWYNQGIPRLHGSVPIYAHPNSLGSVALGVVPFVVFLFPVLRRWFLRLILAGMATTALVVVLYSGSRTAYVGFFGFLFLWFLLSKRKKRWIMIAVIAGAAAFPFIPDHYIGRFQSIGGVEAEGHSKKARIRILEDAWVVFIENPGGIGLGAFPAVRERRFGRSQDTHNLYLEVLTNLGLHGFVVFMGFVSAMAHLLLNAARNFESQYEFLRRWARENGIPPDRRAPLMRHAQDLMFLAAVAKATLAFLGIRLIVGFFGMDLYEIYWWFCAGTTISLAGLTVSTASMTRSLAETN